MRLAAAALALALTCLSQGQESRPVETRAASRATPAPGGTRLVVMIVVDQLASDVLESAWPHLGDGGFRRLARDGSSVPRALYDHACSETGPGHATLATGCPPAVHGIVANEWIDAETETIVGCADDERTPLVPKTALTMPGFTMPLPTAPAA